MFGEKGGGDEDETDPPNEGDEDEDETDAAVETNVEDRSDYAFIRRVRNLPPKRTSSGCWMDAIALFLYHLLCPHAPGSTGETYFKHGHKDMKNEYSNFEAQHVIRDCIYCMVGERAFVDH